MTDIDTEINCKSKYGIHAYPVLEDNTCPHLTSPVIRNGVKDESCCETGISNLPTELMFEIFSYLPSQNNLQKVSKQFKIIDRDTTNNEKRFGFQKWLKDNEKAAKYHGPADLASMNNEIEVLKWLWGKGIKATTYGANLAAKNGNLNILKYLYSKGIKVDQEGFKSAYDRGRYRLTKWLLDNDESLIISEREEQSINSRIQKMDESNELIKLQGDRKKYEAKVNEIKKREDDELRKKIKQSQFSP